MRVQNYYFLLIIIIKIELFGMFPHHFDAFIVLPDFGQVFFVIAGRVDDLLHAAETFSIVNEAHQYWNFGAFCNEIEPFLPVVYLLTGTFGADDEMRVFVLIEHVDHLLRQVVSFTSVHFDGTKLEERPTDDTAFEKLGLDHEFELDAVVPIEAHADEEVGDGSVRRHNQDSVAKVGRDVKDSMPSSEFQAEFADESFKAHLPDVGSVFRGEVHLVFRLDVEGFVEVWHRAEGAVDAGFSGRMHIGDHLTLDKLVA